MMHKVVLVQKLNADLGDFALPQEEWEGEFVKYKASPEFKKVNISMGLEVRPILALKSRHTTIHANDTPLQAYRLKTECSPVLPRPIPVQRPYNIHSDI